jgi:hypothetical protein
MGFFADANIWQNRADIASYQSEGGEESQMMRTLELYGKAATHYAKAQAYALKARQN